MKKYFLFLFLALVFFAFSCFGAGLTVSTTNGTAYGLTENGVTTNKGELNFRYGAYISGVSGNSVLLQDTNQQSMVLYGATGNGLVAHYIGLGQYIFYDTAGTPFVYGKTNGIAYLYTYSPEIGNKIAFAATNGQVWFPSNVTVLRGLTTEGSITNNAQSFQPNINTASGSPSGYRALVQVVGDASGKIYQYSGVISTNSSGVSVGAGTNMLVITNGSTATVNLAPNLTNLSSVTATQTFGTTSSATIVQSSNILVSLYGTNDYPTFDLRFSRGTPASPVRLSTEDYMGALNFWGQTLSSSNNGFHISAAIRNKAVSIPVEPNHITSQLRFFVGNTTTPSALTNIVTFAGGDPCPWVNISTPLELGSVIDGTPGLSLVDHSNIVNHISVQSAVISGSSADNTIRFFGNQNTNAYASFSRTASYISPFLQVESTGAGDQIEWGGGGFNGYLGRDGSGFLYIGGTGNRLLYMQCNGAYRWAFGRSQDTYAFYPFTDNAYDIGLAATRVRSIYAGTSVIAPTVTAATTVTTARSISTNGVTSVAQYNPTAASTFNWTSNNLYAGKITVNASTAWLTNSVVTTNSVVFATINTEDLTAGTLRAVPLAGVIKFSFLAAPTATVDISWKIESP